MIGVYNYYEVNSREDFKMANLEYNLMYLENSEDELVDIFIKYFLKDIDHLPVDLGNERDLIEISIPAFFLKEQPFFSIKENITVLNVLVLEIEKSINNSYIYDKNYHLNEKIEELRVEIFNTYFETSDNEDIKNKLKLIEEYRAECLAGDQILSERNKLAREQDLKFMKAKVNSVKELISEQVKRTFVGEVYSEYGSIFFRLNAKLDIKIAIKKAIAINKQLGKDLANVRIVPRQIVN